MLLLDDYYDFLADSDYANVFQIQYKPNKRVPYIARAPAIYCCNINKTILLNYI